MPKKFSVRKVLEAKKAAEIFFKTRFGIRRFKYESETGGYFDDWVRRFRNGNVEKFADSQSLKVIRNMRKKWKF